MSRPPIDQALWQPWIDHVCAALGADASLVDVPDIHRLAGAVADAFARPMGPVAAHLQGLAVASGVGVGVAAEAITDAARAAR